jgi:hypothetical protein
MPLAVLTLLTKNSNNLPFQRMASADDRYLLWKRVMVGSLSSDRSVMISCQKAIDPLGRTPLSQLGALLAIAANADHLDRLRRNTRSGR